MRIEVFDFSAMQVEAVTVMENYHNCDSGDGCDDSSGSGCDYVDCDSI